MATEERTEQPTPKRRREAREKGQVANSVDLSRAIGLLALYLAWRSTGSYVGDHMMELMRTGLNTPMPTDIAPEYVVARVAKLLPIIAGIDVAAAFPQLRMPDAPSAAPMIRWVRFARSA